MFFQDRMADLRNILTSGELRLRQPSNVCLTQHNPLDPYLRDIFSDVTRVCSLLTNQSNGSTLLILIFEDLLVSTCYRLLQFRSIKDSRAQSDLQSVYDLGLVIIMMTTFLQFDQHRIVNYRLSSLCFQNVMAIAFPEGEQDVTFWLAIVGGIWLQAILTATGLFPRYEIRPESEASPHGTKLNAPVTAFCEYRLCTMNTVTSYGTMSSGACQRQSFFSKKTSRGSRK